MNWLLVADNFVSIGLVFVCWWLAHQNSGGREPFARSIATGYSFLAMGILADMLVHNIADMQWLVPYAEVAVRAVLVITLGAVAARLAWVYAPPPHH